MQTVFDFITQQEAEYKTNHIAITEGWDWNMYDHINLSTLYKNSTYKTGKNEDKPFKNITRPLLNLQYRAEGFDAKDIILYVDDSDEYYMSFLVRKFHEKWARENRIDTFLDDLVESYVDYGGVLVKDVNDVEPEVVPLQRLAFCDQTDILGGPICEKHYYSVSDLRDMAGKWDKEAVEDAITLAQPIKGSQTVGDKKNKTPSKYIEVYELHGTFPTDWLGENDSDVNENDSNEYTGQLHIVAFYKDSEDKNQGITLFSGKEKKKPYKFLARDKIYGRALGLGGAEELFEPQVWTNYDIIRIKGLLDAAAKVIYQTVDAAFANRNTATNVDNGEILITTDPNGIRQINTQPVNLQLFEQATKDWEDHAQKMAGASDALLGENPSSGTPFQLQALVTQQAQQLHTYRQGKLAVFVDEIYRDWVIPYISRAITNGTKFLSELDLDELQEIAKNLSTIAANDFIKNQILSGEQVNPADVDAVTNGVTQKFMAGKNKKFIEILKGEMKDAPLEVEVSIKGKQKDLASMTDKLTNIFRTIMQNPSILQDPIMGKLFNQILEASNLEPLDYSGLKSPQPQMPQNQPQPNQPPQAEPQPAMPMTAAATQ